MDNSGLSSGQPYRATSAPFSPVCTGACPATKVILRLLAVSLLLSSSAVSCFAQDSDWQSMEYEIKAAFLYKFTLYVTWPQDAFDHSLSPLEVGLAAPERFVALLRSLTEDRTVEGRTIRVHRVSGDLVNGLHLLFVARSHEHLLPELQAQLANQPTLLVTESELGLDAGSVIDFAVEQDRVKFDVNISQASSHNLKISAQLLHVARRVEGAQ